MPMCSISRIHGYCALGHSECTVQQWCMTWKNISICSREVTQMAYYGNRHISVVWHVLLSNSCKAQTGMHGFATILSSIGVYTSTFWCQNQC